MFTPKRLTILWLAITWLWLFEAASFYAEGSKVFVWYLLGGGFNAAIVTTLFYKKWKQE